jgi:hypothetical protein
MFVRLLLKIILGIIAYAILFSIFAAMPVYFLWNWLMPVIFGLPIITLSQALGLCLLSGILVKGSTSTSKSTS